MRIRVFCTGCGALTPSGVNAAPGTTVMFKNISTRCIHCGSTAHVDDSVFQIAENSINTIARSVSDKEKIEKFKSLIRNVYNKERDFDKAAKDAEKISPDLGRVIQEAKGAGAFSGSVLLVLLFILSQCQIDIDVTVDINKFLDQMVGIRSDEIISL